MYRRTYFRVLRFNVGDRDNRECFNINQDPSKRFHVHYIKALSHHLLLTIILAITMKLYFNQISCFI